jgi:hypothetical protein
VSVSGVLKWRGNGVGNDGWWVLGVVGECGGGL